MIKSLVCPECGTADLVYEESVPTTRKYLYTRLHPNPKYIFESSSTSFFEASSDEKIVCNEGHEFRVPDDDEIEWV